MLTDLISRHHTIGHQILDLEAELGDSTEPQKETLDMLIQEARRAIQVKEAYTKEEAVRILSTINNVIRSKGLNPNGAGDNQLFYEGIEAKSIDCDNTSLIYMSIADALKLPLAAVNAPKHLFVRFGLNNVSYINWETTSARVISDDYYKQWLNIADAAVKNGVFLRNLTRDGVIANAYNNRGATRADKGNLDKAIEDYNEAIRLDPNFVEAYNNRGNARARKDNLDEAIDDYNEAVRLNPNYALAYYNRGIALYRKGNRNRAIDDYNEAIWLDPNFALAYNNRGNARLRKFDMLGAFADFVRARIPIFR
ncbi:MAG: tetratricopeptide repeat protein [Nanoarchaeota archaeon]